MLITTCNLKTNEESGLVGRSFVHYGCDELIAIQVELKELSVKIKNTTNEKFPGVILSNGTEKDINIVFTDYEGYKVWSCNLYKGSLRLCIFKNT